MCDVVIMPDGGRVIVCGGHRSRKRCACGQPATLLCDWRGSGKKTCDAPICAECTTSPAADKDLCPAHAQAFEIWLAQKERSPSLFDHAAGSGSRPESTPLPAVRQPAPARAGAHPRNPETARA